MNTLIENNYIEAMECDSNFAYILTDNSIFLSTEYKVLQSQANGCFVKCMKTMYNGRIQLYYLTKGLKSFASMLPNMDTECFLTIVTNLLSNIIDVKHNGFLSCQNIDVAFDRIYVDPTTYKVSLVYLPLNKRMHDDYANFENEIRTGLVKLISGISALSSPKTMQFSAALINGTLSIENLHTQLKGGQVVPVNQVRENNRAAITSIPTFLRIIAMNAPTRVEFIISKDEYVIGKKAELCDGVVAFNPMISRSHCKINRNGNQYTITDLQSANGTYVNKIKLPPAQAVPIKNGDVIRLANSDFQVCLG